MKKYFEYMDNIKVSDTLHQRLLNLEMPKKRPAWKKYGGVAAALILVAGVGAWGLSQGGWEMICENFKPAAETTRPEIADIARPDIAIVEPGDTGGPGEPVLGGYEVTYGSGENAIVSYHILPYIEYGDTSGEAVCLDWDLPKGATRRDLTQDEIIALMGGTAAVDDHLDWHGYLLSGWAAWNEDGSFWGAFINGELLFVGGLANTFEFAVTVGQLPPTCFGYPNSVTQEIRGLAVTADKADWEMEIPGGRLAPRCQRRVSFMKDGCGYRFEMCTHTGEESEEMVSRLVARMADKGLALDTLTSDGAVLAHPWEAAPNYGAGEPNYEDSVGEQDSGCPYCADGTVHTHPYDPQAADPSYHAPGKGPDDPGAGQLPGGPDDR